MQPLSDDPDAQPLDLSDVLEPVDADAEAPLLGADPIVRDVRGRVWRVRRRYGVADVAVAIGALATVLAIVIALLRLV